MSEIKDPFIQFQDKLAELREEKTNVIRDYEQHLNDKFAYLHNKKVEVARRYGNGQIETEIAYFGGFKSLKDSSSLVPIFYAPKKDGTMGLRYSGIYEILHKEDELLDIVRPIE